MNQSIKPAKHLIHILEKTKDHHPNFVLFLGAGASTTSGVKTASEMINEWRDKYYKMYSDVTKISREDFFKNPDQHWYESAQEYATLFEKLFDQPSQRREYVEDAIKSASPSWGYIYLVNLLRHNVFNTVITTNFDDLINEACYLFTSEVRPIVCAHDSSIKSIRITSKRPKIIKIHGDFLFDNIKNTVKELESLEENTKEKLKQYASEYGMIVVGYAGHDRSVVDVLNTLLRQEHNFPHGIYWCIKKGATISKTVEDLRRFPKFHVVEIDGFDEFFAETNEALKLSMPLEMTSPFDALSTRLNGLCDQIKVYSTENLNPIIQKDLRNLAEKIAEWTEVSGEAEASQNSAEQQKNNVESAIPIPLEFMIEVDMQNKQFTSAKSRLDSLIKQHPLPRKAISFSINYGVETNDFSFAKTVIDILEKHAVLFKDSPDESLTYFVNLMNEKQYDLADRMLQIGLKASKLLGAGSFSIPYYLINKAQVLIAKTEEFPKDLKTALIELTENSRDISACIGANIVLANYDAALKQLLNLGKVDIQSWLKWPITQLLPNEYKAQLLEKVKL